MEINLNIINKINVKNVVVNEQKKVVTVVLDDGRAFLAKCSPNDEFDPKVGFAIAFLQAYYGSKTKAYKFFDKKARFVNSKPKATPKATTTEGVKSLAKAAKDERNMLDKFLCDNKLTYLEAAKLTGLSITTIKRACWGYRVNRETMFKLKSNLGLPDDIAIGLSKQLKRRQTHTTRKYTN